MDSAMIPNKTELPTRANLPIFHPGSVAETGAFFK
jgi:hypothetical protein